MQYDIKIENFEGPIDLLLFFIKRDKLNIYDIPIAHIMKEFFDYLKMMEIMNIDIGSDFIYMGSLLMKIKSKMLLPQSHEDEDLEDPRTLLVERILEYKKYKLISKELKNIFANQQLSYSVGSYDIKVGNNDELVGNTSLYKLSLIYKDLITRLPEVNPYVVNEADLSIDDQVVFLRNKLLLDKKIIFNELDFVIKKRLELVITFLAVLELLRRKEILIVQEKPFSQIILTQNIN